MEFGQVDIGEPFFYEGALCWKVDVGHYMEQGFHDVFALDDQTLVSEYKVS